MKLKLEHIIGERYLGNRVKKILFLFVFLLLLGIGNRVFATCEDKVENWYPGAITGNWHDISIEVTPSGRINKGDTVQIKVNIISQQEIPDQTTGGRIVLDMDFGEAGNPEQIGVRDYTQGMSWVFNDECTVVPNNGFSDIDCTFVFSHTYTSRGDKSITAYLHTVLEDYGTCQEKIINVYDDCGNGVMEWDKEEECDGTDFGGKTCTQYGFTGGQLECRLDCTVDTSKCTEETAIELPKKYPNALSWENILEFLKYAVTWIFMVGSGLAVLMILIGAFIIVTSAGDPNRAEKGKKTVIWAVIGFVVTMTVNGIIALLKAIIGAE